MDKRIKRKRDAELPRITFNASGRYFERLLRGEHVRQYYSALDVIGTPLIGTSFTEESLSELEQAVRRKLNVPNDVAIKMSQLRSSRVIDLEDDDDFDAFYSAIHSSSESVTVIVKVEDGRGLSRDSATAESHASESHPPANKRRKLATEEPPQRETTSTSQPDDIFAPLLSSVSGQDEVPGVAVCHSVQEPPPSGVTATPDSNEGIASETNGALVEEDASHAQHKDFTNQLAALISNLPNGIPEEHASSAKNTAKANGTVEEVPSTRSRSRKTKNVAAPGRLGVEAEVQELSASTKRRRKNQSEKPAEATTSVNDASGEIASLAQRKRNAKTAEASQAADKAETKKSRARRTPAPIEILPPMSTQVMRQARASILVQLDQRVKEREELAGQSTDPSGSLIKPKAKGKRRALSEAPAKSRKVIPFSSSFLPLSPLTYVQQANSDVSSNAANEPQIADTSSKYGVKPAAMEAVEEREFEETSGGGKGDDDDTSSTSSQTSTSSSSKGQKMKKTRMPPRSPQPDPELIAIMRGPSVSHSETAFLDIPDSDTDNAELQALDDEDEEEESRTKKARKGRANWAPRKGTDNSDGDSNEGSASDELFRSQAPQVQSNKAKIPFKSLASMGSPSRMTPSGTGAFDAAFETDFTAGQPTTLRPQSAAPTAYSPSSLPPLPWRPASPSVQEKPAFRQVMGPPSRRLSSASMQSSASRVSHGGQSLKTKLARDSPVASANAMPPPSTQPTKGRVSSVSRSIRLRPASQPVKSTVFSEPDAHLAPSQAVSLTQWTTLDRPESSPAVSESFQVDELMTDPAKGSSPAIYKTSTPLFNLAESQQLPFPFSQRQYSPYLDEDAESEDEQEVQASVQTPSISSAPYRSLSSIRASQQNFPRVAVSTTKSKSNTPAIDALYGTRLDSDSSDPDSDSDSGEEKRRVSHIPISRRAG
ncbi:hypothetical protein FISHEDRAFT_72960 [Fistulina hepatica ATCC 64428]|uniref:Uncharacterized protein n=1 Tax=Fistulina hepatica ATCC 64428 TaxID=1128425 RepID=A0A0D7AFB1_9AGAR|nr:hypothetical protein FISHEDRAFT_72960 [Fistulina hepatica ATCC 64428]